jgi:hypothetical protein
MTNKSLRQDGSRQTLCDDKGIVPERSKQFLQDFRLFGVSGHAHHLGLQLVSSYRLLPVSLQRLRVAQIAFDFLFDVRLRHHSIERRFGAGVGLWPDPVTPVNVFDRCLIRDALREGQRSAHSDHRRGDECRARAPVRDWQIDRRAESDNHARKEQRTCAAPKNVSVKFGFCFHRYTPSLDL